MTRVLIALALVLAATAADAKGGNVKQSPCLINHSAPGCAKS